MPAQDPASFARCLAPYLKICPSDLALPKPEQRRAAERLLCILSVVSALMGRLDRLPVEAAQDLELDLVQLINAHHFVQVSLLCQLLCMCLSLCCHQRLAEAAHNLEVDPCAAHQFSPLGTSQFAVPAAMHVPAEAAQDLQLDLMQLINAHRFVQVS